MAIPYQNKKSSKKQQVEEMFDKIADKYDFFNHFFSLSIDKIWRKKTINLLKAHNPETILDIATGTGDLAIEASKLKPKKIVGIDISEGMLKVGKEKISRKNLQNMIELKKGDAEKLEFDNEYFDTAIVAFGVRNFENLEKGINEIFRVLKPAGKFVVLEFSKPKNAIIKFLYAIYFQLYLPIIGKLFSSDTGAYTYLPESVKTFPDGEKFLNKLKNVGFTETKQISLSMGIASIYVAKKS
jgi:demethylmenaquinone methyltransferase / 2-methoxy-6-polyprenyl-1,4-benzoquinol methylase